MKIFNKYYLTVCKGNYPLSCKIQAFLQFFGIALHNPFRDECCIDFQCCNAYHSKKDRCWLHIHQKYLPFRIKRTYMPTAPVGTPGRTFVTHRKLVFFSSK